jgi:hypothetical protein
MIDGEAASEIDSWKAQNYMAALEVVLVGWARGAVSQVDACGAKYG